MTQLEVVHSLVALRTHHVNGGVPGQVSVQEHRQAKDPQSNYCLAGRPTRSLYASSYSRVIVCRAEGYNVREYGSHVNTRGPTAQGVFAYPIPK
jgi:hypothetical protein